MIRRKASRRSSAQYFISAEDHVENEVKHERLLTETSRLSSSWASLSVSGTERTESECSSSSASANNSPSHRLHSFSGPLVISVTCSSNSACAGIHNCCPTQSIGGRATPTSPTPHIISSGHASPVASPVSSRVQCYSPGFVSATNSPTPRRPPPGSASPLLISTALCRKRGYLSSMPTGGGCSSDDASREASPDPFVSSRGTKSMRQGDGRVYFPVDVSQFRWPISGPSVVSNPPSPSCQLFPNPMGVGNTPSSPSTSSLPSPQHSTTSLLVPFSASSSLSTSSLNNSSSLILAVSQPITTTISTSIVTRISDSNAGESLSNCIDERSMSDMKIATSDLKSLTVNKIEVNEAPDR